MRNYTNIGVQLMPMLLVVCSVVFYYLQNNFAFGMCFLLGVFMWFALFGEKKQ